MGIRFCKAPFRRMSETEIESWRQIPAAVASDCQNRSMGLSGRIQALKPGWRICGQARTVAATPGDNACVHWLCSTAAPGEVVVVGAGGLVEVSMLGEMVVRQSRLRRLGGIVVDGATRDTAAILELDFPVFSAGRAPRGPHKEFGGYIDLPVAVGGVAVRPGDLILGDEDGVSVVPLEKVEIVLDLARRHLLKEEGWVTAMEAGKTLVEIFGVAQPEAAEC